MIRIDLNCDLGESDALASIDEALVRIVTSANIATGGHAGDETSMLRTVRACLASGTAIGAHPSYPDRPNFGRVDVPMTPQDITLSVAGQIASLRRIARAQGSDLTHIKPHGALYHAAATRREVATAIASAASTEAPGAALVGPSGSPCISLWRDMGFDVIAEAFADRLYEPDGALRSRSIAGAVLTAPAIAASQALDIAVRHTVMSADGTALHIIAQSLCVHSDTPDSVHIARAVRDALEAAGVRVAHA